jgi:hypothetical protein
LDWRLSRQPDTETALWARPAGAPPLRTMREIKESAT